ncbi:MAG: M67 family metallopeptidase [Acidobacteriota bacterium]|nr:M67 family metallopeptidase [Acidobacteriota bacterium]
MSSGSLPQCRPSLHISGDQLSVVRRHAEVDYPEECCGVLVGVRHDGVTRVTAVVETPNRSRARTGKRYEISPRDLLGAMLDARARGEDVVGYYHSHPDGRARPSDVDRGEAWRGVSYLIVAVREGTAGEIRSWRFAERSVDEEAIVSVGPEHTGCGETER